MLIHSEIFFPVVMNLTYRSLDILKIALWNMKIHKHTEYENSSNDTLRRLTLFYNLVTDITHKHMNSTLLPI